MKQNTSLQRQNDLLSELLSLIRSRVDGQQELSQQWQKDTHAARTSFAAKQQEASRKLLVEHDDCESAYQRRLVACREELDAQSQSVENEFQEKLAVAQKQAQTATSDGEYDWFLSKQRTKKEFAADKTGARESYKVARAKLKQHGNNYNDLASAAKATLGRHRCKLTIQGGDLLEAPDAGDHLAAHLQTSQQIEELIRQFRSTFWIRFQEDRWFLIAFLLGVIAFAYPLYLMLQNVTLAGIATTVAGVVCAAISWFISQSLATKTANRFRESFVTSIATGKQQLLAAQHQNKRHRDAKLQLLTTQYRTTEEDLDREWSNLQTEIRRRIDRRATELRTWAAKRNEAILLERKRQEEALATQFVPQLDEYQQQLQRTKEKLSRSESDQLSEYRSNHAAQFDALAKSWMNGVAAVVEEAKRMSQLGSQSLFDYSKTWDSWRPVTEPADVVRFGRLKIDLAALPDGSSSDQRFRIAASSCELPATIDLVHSPSLMIENAASEKQTATQILRLIMLRLLTSIPPGKLRFTIIDPVGLGRDFAAFMHLGDHDEQLINHRIWTETNHINSRLADLTQHMENIIQTYLRNEFDSIQDYNDHAGEVAEAFRVLVVADFPAGFSEEAAGRLLSIANSGPRCGVYTLLSVDPEQPMPRNFDLGELRKNTSVVVTSENETHWANPPLSGFAIQLDDLPTEEKISEVMQAVGSRAKDANRVEVPFSAVAPPESEWWTGDGRAELNVPLGRAGATKLQSMRLGHGTSQHVLISGKTGSGKSTLLHALITNLALKYSPNEVQFYLVDFKKGVEFKSYAEHKLPHARVIAIESEREFGQSVLQRLDVELRRRGDLFRRVGVQSIAGYRDARPDERMPRILLVIDEFQEFFVKEDKIAQEASLLLDRLVRQGRAFGIHVLLGSQTLAGAYSLARATIGQMAVRVALQCSATDAHLILSDDNDAARLLRRPGDAIYNDANGMVEGNHPFQVVWLSDVEKSSYLHKLASRHAASDSPIEEPIVFEGNVAAQVASNEMLNRSWEAPAPVDIPLAPRAWLGEAIAIKEAPAAIFHRRSGSNLMLVGQQEEAALGVMASSLLSLAAFSPVQADRETRFVVLDGTRPESTEAGYWSRLKETSGLDLSIVKSRDALAAIQQLTEEVADRQEGDDDQRAATFLFVYNLARFRDLQKSDDDFGFGGFGQEESTRPAEQLAHILREGPGRGVHTILWSDTYTNLTRWIDRESLRDIEARVLFQMSATDSSNLMDSSAASQLGSHRAIFYSEDQGRAERFRPYGLPNDDFLLRVRSLHASPKRKQGTLS